MSIEKNFAGLDSFIWWLGVVENRKDPLSLGRCQVRIFGIHTESLTDIPSADLPWASPVHALNSHMFTTPKETDVVFGFFADGRNSQVPIMMGILPGYETNPKSTGSGFHDLRDPQEIRYAPKLPVARTYTKDGSGIVVSEANTANNGVLETLRHPRDYELGKATISGVSRYELSGNTVIDARKQNLDTDVISANGITWSEPYPAYNPLYPYNQSMETESGHVFELDDTPRSERISLNHRTGTYMEIFPSGTKVEKITKSNYQIIMADDHLHVMGKVAITVDSDAYIKVLGNVNLEVGNDLSAKISGMMDLSVKEALNIKAQSLNIDIAEDATLVTGGGQFMTAAGNIEAHGAAIAAKSDGSFDVLVGGAANIQSGGSLNLLGSVINLNSGGGASTASDGVVTGLETPAARGNPNKATPSDERTPIPIPGNQFATLDAHTGTAVKQESFLKENPKDPDGDKLPPELPPPQSCSYNPTGKTFINKADWQIGPKGLAFIKSSEGYAKSIGGGKVQGYPDPATHAEPITIGYGTTGPAVDQTITLNTVIDRAKAEEYLAYAINKKFMPTLKQTINVDLTQEMIDACLSLMYNIGGGNFRKSSVVTKANQKDWCGAGDAFLAWNKANHKVLAGLTDRRQKERTLFLS